MCQNTVLVESNSSNVEYNINKINRKLLAPAMAESAEFVCGFGAALINISVTFPMNKLMFRQMLHGISSKDAVKQLKKEGFKNLYRGILPPLCQKTVSTSIMFGMFEKYKKMIQLRHPTIHPGATICVAAALAGFTEGIMCPFERVQTLLQDKKYHNKYKNSVHCASDLRHHGIREYYRGVLLILVRNGVSNILFFGLRNKLKDAALVRRTDRRWYSNVIVHFVSGALLGAFISTVTYPINVVKTHIQVQIGGGHSSIASTFYQVYESRGHSIRGLFRGVHVNYTRALVSWGIINTSYELLMKTFFNDSTTRS